MCACTSRNCDPTKFIPEGEEQLVNVDLGDYRAAVSNSDDGPVQPAGKWSPVDTAAYDQQWQEMAAQGHNPHGEVDLVMGYEPTSVLDAGCGTGRIAIELARRGVAVVGVDLDASMIDAARKKAPEVRFEHNDLMTVDCRRRFDTVVMAGNVMIFVHPGTEAAVVENMARHVEPGGVLIAGFQLTAGLSADTYDGHAKEAGLTVVERWSTWDRDPWLANSNYGVFVHRRRVDA